MIRPASLALYTALALGAPAVASAAPAAPVAAQVEQSHTTAPTQAPADDAAHYAQREHQDKQVANYQGGNVVVIGISGTALVVLLLILLLI